MRSLLAAVCAALLMTAAAHAAQTEGLIKKIDRDDLKITLDDGKSYKLPGEFDLDSIKEGMDIVIAYDEVGGENLITDMQLPESE